MSDAQTELVDALRVSSLDPSHVEHTTTGLDEARGPADGEPGPSSKTKKKRAKKKSTPAPKDDPVVSAVNAQSLSDLNNVLISRSKHLKYISSYHGNWLNLPPGLLDVTLEYNEEARIDYRKLASEERRLFQTIISDMNAEKQAVTDRASAKAPLRIDQGKSRDAADGPSVTEYVASRDLKMPPAVDRAAIRNVLEVRRLLDNASDLLTRASSGLTAAELTAMNDATSDIGNSYIHSKSRPSTTSPARQARLRAMAISQLAQAFRIDEIATSVVLMQSATSFDEIAKRILKSEPGNLDAAYVMYFQERIPSRTLCLSTPADILDRIVDAHKIDHPHLPIMYRSRGVLHLYRQDYAAAIRDFEAGLRTFDMQSARRVRSRAEPRSRGSGKRKGHRDERHTRRAFDDADQDENEAFEIGPVGQSPGDDLGRHLIFMRGMAFFLWACNMIERESLMLEGVTPPTDGLSNEGGEVSLEAIGLKISNGARGLFDNDIDPLRAARFCTAFAPGTPICNRVCELLHRSLKDHERFQACFPVLEVPPGSISSDVKQEAEDVGHAARSTAIDRSISFRGRRLVHARALTGRIATAESREDGLNTDPRLYMSYHPMLGESLFTQLLAELLLGNFVQVLRLHYRATRIMAGVDTGIDGKAFFLLGRSLSQSEYHEIFERLAHIWLPLRHNDNLRSLTETEAAARGSLASLAHVTAFFTPEHELQLYNVYIEVEQEYEDMRHQTEQVHPHAKKLLGYLNGKSSSASNRPAPPAKSHAYGPHTTARAEIAATWLMAAHIVPLEEEELAQRRLQNGHTEGGSSSFAATKASIEGL